MRSTATPAAARAERRGSRGRHRPTCDRHGNRRFGHLPRGDQRHRRVEADRRAGQPHATSSRSAPARTPPGPMTATVREAAELLTAIAGSDPADPATRRGRQAQDATMPPRSIADSLKGKRIGVMRFASGFGTDERIRHGAGRAARARARPWSRSRSSTTTRSATMNCQVLLTEFKAGLNDYLKASPPPIR